MQNPLTQRTSELCSAQVASLNGKLNHTVFKDLVAILWFLLFSFFLPLSLLLTTSEEAVKILKPIAIIFQMGAL